MPSKPAPALQRCRCILKDGEAPGVRPTIVLGIGGKAEKLVHLDRVGRAGVPLLRRFSGGGTVVVDEDSLFVTFIMNTVRACVAWRLALYCFVPSCVGRRDEANAGVA
jgi:hypothetical protein